jgi:hypothetical protein
VRQLEALGLPQQVGIAVLDHYGLPELFLRIEYIIDIMYFSSRENVKSMRILCYFSQPAPEATRVALYSLRDARKRSNSVALS